MTGNRKLQIILDFLQLVAAVKQKTQTCLCLGCVTYCVPFEIGPNKKNQLQQQKLVQCWIATQIAPSVASSRVQSSTNWSAGIRKMPGCCLDLSDFGCHLSYVTCICRLGEQCSPSQHCYVVVLQMSFVFPSSAGLAFVIPMGRAVSAAASEPSSISYWLMTEQRCGKH